MWVVWDFWHQLKLLGDFMKVKQLLAQLQSLFGPTVFPMMHCTKDCQKRIFNMHVTMPQVVQAL